LEYSSSANELETNKGGNYTITFDLCQKRGVRFDGLIDNEILDNTPDDSTNTS
jgi:hypothetical protein